MDTKISVDDWMSQQFQHIGEEQERYAEVSGHDMPWDEALQAYPLLCCLLLRTYRSRPYCRKSTERFSELCLGLPLILSAKDYRLSEEHLLLLAYSLGQDGYTFLPAAVKNKLSTNPLFNKELLEQNLCIFFALKIVREAAQQQRYFSEPEVQGLRSFFHSYQFAAEGSDDDRLLASLIKQHVENPLAQAELRKQIISLFLQSISSSEFKKRFDFLKSTERWTQQDNWLALSLISKTHLHIELEDFFGPQRLNFLKNLPDFKYLYNRHIEGIELRKQHVKTLIAGLIEESYNRSIAFFYDTSCAATRPGADWMENAIRLAAHGATFVAAVSSANQLLSSYRQQPPTAGLEQPAPPNRSWLGWGGSMCQSHFISLQGLSLAYCYRHHLSYLWQRRCGHDPYRIFRKNFDLELERYLNTIEANAQLEDVLAGLQKTINKCSAPFRLNVLFISCEGSFIENISDYDWAHHMDPRSQIRIGVRDLLTAMDCTQRWLDSLKNKDIGSVISLFTERPLIFSGAARENTPPSLTPRGG